MPPEIDVTNETTVPIRSVGVTSVVAAVLAAEAVDGAVDVAFLDEAPIAELNQRYRGVSGATDVLSFPGGADDEGWPEPPEIEAGVFLGDVLICPSVAERQAAEDGSGLGEELVRLLVHGTLHLLGYDHEVDVGEMRQREADLLDGLLSLSGELLSES